MTRRKHLFSVLNGSRPATMPFFPDITQWYVSRRTPPGEPRAFGPGEFIPDGHPIHDNPGTMPEEFLKYTWLDFHRNFNWGCFAHIYDWYDTTYTDGVELEVVVKDGVRRTIYHTPGGDLTAVDRLSVDGVWVPRERFARDVRDLAILSRVVMARRYTPRYDRMQTVLDGIGNLGAADTVVFYSPFGRLVHDYMGIEEAMYALADSPATVKDFLALEETCAMELVQLAAAAPPRLVIISDHPDEFLISPPYYRDYCMPFYRRANDVLHAAGKLVSNHLDGNCRGLFPLLAQTGFDYLDGCTPDPMYNYTVESLSLALPADMTAFCGVPSVLFSRHHPENDLFRSADRILTALAGRGVLNIGDILPVDADIQQVIALGEYVKNWRVGSSSKECAPNRTSAYQFRETTS